MANQLERMQLFDSVMVGPSSNRIWIVASSLFLSISTSPPSGSVDFGCDCAKKKQTKNDSESPAEPLSRTQFAATSDRDLADELLSLFSKCSVENYVGGATFRCFFFFCAIGTGETAVTRRRPDQHCRSFIVVVFIFFVFPILLAVAVVASTIQIRSLRLLVFSIVAGVEVVAIFSDRVWGCRLLQCIRMIVHSMMEKKSRDVDVFVFYVVLIVAASFPMIIILLLALLLQLLPSLLFIASRVSMLSLLLLLFLRSHFFSVLVDLANDIQVPAESHVCNEGRWGQNMERYLMKSMETEDVKFQSKKRKNDEKSMERTRVRPSVLCKRNDPSQRKAVVIFRRSWSFVGLFFFLFDRLP